MLAIRDFIAVLLSALIASAFGHFGVISKAKPPAQERSQAPTRKLEWTGSARTPSDADLESDASDPTSSTASAKKPNSSED